MPGETATDRRVLRLTGADAHPFLQNLVTNTVPKDGLVWTAILTPQGKYLADFFLKVDGGTILLDVAAPMADVLLRRLTLYKLRADVAIEEADLTVTRGLGDPPEGADPDPRHPELGWRGYGLDGGEASVDWDAIRVAHCIPESGVELIPDETFILEAGFERLNGVDFRKGCYVGQEVTARMKHKTELRKGLATVAVAGAAAPGDEIAAGGKTVGRLHTRSGDRGIAYLRYDRAGADMTAGDGTVSWPT